MSSPQPTPGLQLQRRSAFILLLFALAAVTPLFAGRKKDEEKKEADDAAAKVNAYERPESQFAIAIEAAEKNDWPRAHAYIDNAVLKAPLNDQYVYAKAHFYFQAGNYAAALEWAKKAEAMKGEVGAAQHLQAMALQALGKLDEAEPIFSRLCLDANFVRNQDTCGNLGELYGRMSELAADAAAKNNYLLKARNAFIHLVELNSKDPRGHYFLGKIALEQGQWAEAASRCNTGFNLLEQLGYGNNALPKLGPLYALCAAKAELKVNNRNHAQELIMEACRISPSAEDCHRGEMLLRESGL
jgi:tetratricopeptide (TPR) repeat protein